MRYRTIRIDPTKGPVTFRHECQDEKAVVIGHHMTHFTAPSSAGGKVLHKWENDPIRGKQDILLPIGPAELNGHKLGSVFSLTENVPGAVGFRLKTTISQGGKDIEVVDYGEMSFDGNTLVPGDLLIFRQA